MFKKLFDSLKENKIIFISILISLICIISVLYNLIYLSNHSKSIEYWSLFWTGISILPIPISLVTFLWNQKKENDRFIQESYLSFQYDFFEKHAQTIVEFKSTFREKDNEDKSNLVTKKLTKDLVALLFALNDINLKFIEDKIQFNNDSLIDLDQINSQVFEIITSDDNKNIIEIIQQYYPELIDTFKTIQINSTSNKLNTTKNDLNDDMNNKILGHWYMSDKRARKSKYLIGVATKDKRILGTFSILHPSEIVKNNANRLYFGNASTPIYNAPAKDNGLDITMPGLETWTAQNPIMYYKSYIESKGITLTNDNISNIEKALKLNAGDFKKLNSDDIIIVRTYKFDVKDKDKNSDVTPKTSTKIN